MSTVVPAAFAVAGTALMAMAFFGPFRRTVEAGERRATRAPVATAPWTALVEASATACDAPARIDLAEALGALQSSWAETILRTAFETEPDPDVRSAIATALQQAQARLSSSTHSLVM